MSEPVVVTGATGFIGAAVVRRLAHAGVPVRALSRAGSAPDLPGVTGWRYDLEAEPDPAVFSGASAVVHTAFVAEGPGADAARVNVEAAERLARVCRSAGVKAVFLSSFSAHAGGRSRYARAKLAAERAFDPTRDVVLKLGLVVGPGGMWLRMDRNVSARPVVPVVGGRKPLQLVALDDVVQAVHRAADPDVAGTFWVAEPRSLPLRVIYRSLVRRNAVLVPVPIAAALAGARAAERLGVALPISADSVAGLARMEAHSTERDLRKLGISPRGPDAVLGSWLASTRGATC